ncbi:bifunctional PIG-L family deacetylase/class I SAM-dependent methyltransferase [Pedobacter sandarakinus]|uniref:bifunctional PIG-L family deacetylase/class I SAM-dependent methyltransferase n=1 Tax=Pedobacter sandarakinus TaxID=353156 RepID=UPI0022482874|nr:bifunctional PIG-L family deacetylase/class I SAM-dependent methyltransferase [Pedobacter sandarakinus]MCX2574139.1 bifunctional PIG-L family deacetylase/class I SAM-dependent methyltransferase [Pedobacter sandarakinus]
MNNAFDIDGFVADAVELQYSDLNFINRCLVLIPHPDDESLACAGLVATLRERGIQFRFILTTDGSRSHPNSVKYPAEKLAQLRKKELEEALTLMGMSPSLLTCYQCTDASMPARGDSGFSELVAKLAADLGNFKPDLILVPYELDPHCDHRATWQLLMAALEKGPISRPTIWEYPIWLYANAESSDVPKLKPGELRYLDVSSFNDLKRSCIAAHQSQVSRLIDDDPSGFMLHEDMIANFTSGREYFMERAKINPSASLPEDYFESLYRTDNDPWKFESSAYEQGKYEATLAVIPKHRYSNALEIGCSIGVFTEKLEAYCEALTGIDLSETALAKAKKRMFGFPQVKFILGGIPSAFPKDTFDLIVMSEVGYYLSVKDLATTRSLIQAHMRSKGILVLVHWTHFVVDYPISGDQVHEYFLASPLIHVHGQRSDDYRIDVFQQE